MIATATATATAIMIIMIMIIIMIMMMMINIIIIIIIIIIEAQDNLVNNFTSIQLHSKAWPPNSVYNNETNVSCENGWRKTSFHCSSLVCIPYKNLQEKHTWREFFSVQHGNNAMHSRRVSRPFYTVLQKTVRSLEF